MQGQWTIRPQSCQSRLKHHLLRLQRFTSIQVRPPPSDNLGPTREDAHQTLRLREDGARRELPLPPLLDPVILRNKLRWTNTKAQPKPAEFTPFQKKLQANVYAHALASPVRQCRANLISLPVAFLTSLHARPHPTTNDPWLLPVSLTTDKKHLGPPYQFTGRHFVAAQLSKKKAWEKGLYARITEKLGNGNVKRMVWREDLPDLILGLMQDSLIKKLSWNFGFRGRLIPVASPRPKDIDHVDDVSCMLIFGSLHTRADDVHDRARAIMDEMEKWSSYVAKSFEDKLDPHAAPEVTHKSPSWYVEPLIPRLQSRLHFPELEFKTTLWRGKKVAVYSLTDLLGDEKAQQMISGSKYEGERCVVVKTARQNVSVELLLMQLQAFIARPGP